MKLILSERVTGPEAIRLRVVKRGLTGKWCSAAPRRSLGRSGTCGWTWHQPPLPAILRGTWECRPTHHSALKGPHEYKDDKTPTPRALGDVSLALPQSSTVQTNPWDQSLWWPHLLKSLHWLVSPEERDLLAPTRTTSPQASSSSRALQPSTASSINCPM